MGVLRDHVIRLEIEVGEPVGQFTRHDEGGCTWEISADPRGDRATAFVAVDHDDVDPPPRPRRARTPGLGDSKPPGGHAPTAGAPPRWQKRGRKPQPKRKRKGE